MAFLRRAAFPAAIFLLAQHPRTATSFGVHHPLSASRRARPRSAVRAEPSPSEKAAELRQKAEAAKRKAEELKKVAEQKAAAAMAAVQKSKSAQESSVGAPSPAVAATTPQVSAPAADAAPAKASTRAAGEPAGGAIIPINAANVEFASGILGGAVALALGASPLLAAAAAAAANYVAKKDDLGEANELVQGLSKVSLNTINWLVRLDAKYEIVGKLSDSLDRSLDELKNSGGNNAETVQKVEDTVAKTTKQIQQLADDIDLIEGSKQALGAVGEVLETSLDKAFDANKEYKLTERASGAAKKAVEKAKGVR